MLSDHGISSYPCCPIIQMHTPCLQNHHEINPCFADQTCNQFRRVERNSSVENGREFFLQKPKDKPRIDICTKETNESSEKFPSSLKLSSERMHKSFAPKNHDTFHQDQSKINKKFKQRPSSRLVEKIKAELYSSNQTVNDEYSHPFELESKENHSNTISISLTRRNSQPLCSTFNFKSNFSINNVFNYAQNRSEQNRMGTGLAYPHLQSSSILNCKSIFNDREASQTSQKDIQIKESTFLLDDLQTMEISQGKQNPNRRELSLKEEIDFEQSNDTPELPVISPTFAPVKTNLKPTSTQLVRTFGKENRTSLQRQPKNSQIFATSDLNKLGSTSQNASTTSGWTSFPRPRTRSPAIDRQSVVEPPKKIDFYVPKSPPIKGIYMQARNNSAAHIDQFDIDRTTRLRKYPSTNAAPFQR